MKTIATWEYTDTFGREANYAWVKRGEIELPETIKTGEIVRLVKRDAGLTGVRMIRQEYGDMIELRPVGICAVLFITFEQISE